MKLGGGPGQVPDLLKPAIEIFLFDLAGLPLGLGRLAVASRFPLHQDEFHIVFDDRVGLIRLAEEF